LKRTQDRSDKQMLKTGSDTHDPRGAKTMSDVFRTHSNRQEIFMTKTTKALLTSAAFAGLFAGTGAAVKASTLLPSLNNSFSAQDQDQGDKKDDQKVKEKHACKGQNSCKGKGGCKASDNGCKGKNSCKGKGGCATDGSKPPQE
jgi:hypothetical protein